MHAVTYVKFLNDGEFQEKLFCCKELPPTSKEQDIFNVVSSYLETKVCLGGNALLSSQMCPINGWLSTGFTLFCLKKKKKQKIF